ncbi:MAG TPA: hydroxymethylbilane synthase [Vicinamibacterales bacterium]|jgi:hydroxymethylbilane synthase|nr:hydroxymethylbilane synthase [Vicinamibacterales bacterium]
MTATLRLGTRGSALALWQARTVAGLLEARGCRVDLRVIKTAGDRLQDAPGAASSGKGVFVTEIEDALLAREIDLAVHSAKDMPASMPDGLVVGAVLPREDARDALVLPHALTDLAVDAAVAALGARPAIGTSSVRRSAQLRALIPGARFVPVRGNVDTRLRKLDAGEFDAIVLAVAGMKRLGFGGRITAALSHEQCIPAPGQGIVAVQTRSDDRALRDALAGVSDAAAAASFDAERELVAALGGGCQLPLGGIAVHAGGGLDMRAIVTSIDGQRAIRERAQGDVRRPAELGRRVADALAKAGAMGILDEVR